MDNYSMAMPAAISNEHKLYLKKMQSRQMKIKLLQLFIFVGFFALWETAARLKWIDAFIFSQPSRIFTAFAAMVANGSIFMHIGVTLGETAAGFIFSTVVGTLAAILLWWNPFVEKVVAPYLVILNSLPKTALAPIIIVWIGNNIYSVIFTAIITSIIVTIISVTAGFFEVSKDKIKLIRTLGGTKKQIMKMVVLPASIPTVVSALKINVGLSLVGVMVGEFLVAKAGLGYLIMYGSQVFKMDWVMLSIIILCVMAWLLYRIVVLLEKKLSFMGTGK